MGVLGLWKDPKPENERDWPHDQSYASICDACCEDRASVTPDAQGAPDRNDEVVFYGPKRAPSCWKHVSHGTQQWWLSVSKQSPER